MISLWLEITELSKEIAESCKEIAKLRTIVLQQLAIPMIITCKFRVNIVPVFKTVSSMYHAVLCIDPSLAENISKGMKVMMHTRFPLAWFQDNYFD